MAAKIDRKTIARNSPAGFAWYASDGAWIPAPHLKLLSRKIVDVAAGRTPRLIVAMPPRHGKSELISRYTPAWYLGRFPDNKVILTSYSDTFAASWGRRARDTFREHVPRLFGVDVNPETAGGQQWEVAGHDGIMVTAGVGGGITGKGAHLLIIDDPVKNAEDAASEVKRAAAIEWWKSTARTRLQKGAGVILVMTRWHEDDLAGKLLGEQMSEGGDEWEVLSLPAFAEAETTFSYSGSKKLQLGPDALGRSKGDVLWPEMFDEKWMEQTRRALGHYWFNALYLQRPSAAEGNLFKESNFRYYEKLPTPRDSDANLVRIVRDQGDETFNVAYGTKFMTIDCAESEKKSADYTVISTWVVTVNKDLLLWDRTRVKMDVTKLKPTIRREFFEQRPSFVVIEKKSVGTALIAELLMEGLPIVPTTPDADKVTRAIPAVARYEEHRVFHPMGESWVKEEWEPELKNFPNASHDDQVDTLSIACQQLPIIGGLIAGTKAPAGTIRTGGKTIAGGVLTRDF